MTTGRKGRTASRTEGTKAFQSKWSRVFLAGKRPYLWLALFVIVLYARTLWFGFTYFDDDSMILRNTGSIGSLKNIWTALTGNLNRGATPYYRPLLDISLIINHAICRSAPWGYHLINILLHLGACYLLYGFLKRTGVNSLMSLLLTTLFAVHPANTAAVAWIPGRNDILLALFAIPMLSSFISFINGFNRTDLMMSMALYGACLLTKETALMLPPVCLSYVLINDRRCLKKKELWTVAGLWLLISLVWGWARGRALGFNPELQASRLQPVTYMVDVLWSYLGKAFFAAGLSPVAVLTNPSLVWGLAAAVLLAGMAFWGGLRNRGWFFFGLAWMLLTTAPNLITGSFIPLALEHRFYLPFMGLLVAVSQMLFINLDRNWKMWIAVLLVAVAGVKSFSYAGDFSGRRPFWDKARETSPGNALVHYNLGLMYQERGQLQSALEEYNAALRLSPDYAAVYNSLGTVEQALGRNTEAEKAFLKAISLRSNFPEARCNLGGLYFSQGRLRPAEDHLLECIRVNPRSAPSHNSLGSIYYHSGRLDRARQEFLKAIELDPGLADAHNNLGSVFLAEGLLPEAEAEYKRSLGISAWNLLAVLNLGQMYVRTGRLAEAEELLMSAIRAEPGQPLFHEQLSYVYYLRKKYSLAVVSYDRALALGAAADSLILGKLKPYR